MRILTTIVLIGSISAFHPRTAGAVDDPWADEVIDYFATDPVAGFTTAANALGAPDGLGPNVPLNTDNVVSLGTPNGAPRSRITLKFNTPVIDDAANPNGLDFIVFSNAFWIGGDPQKRFQEPAVVEISEDGSTWYFIPGSRSYSYTGGALPVVNEASGADNESDSSLLAGAIRNPNTFDGDAGNDNDESNWGYAELSPTLAPYRDNYLRPDDPGAVGIDGGSGGGDAFDIAWAIQQNGQPAAITQFQYIRISPFINRTLTVGLASPEVMAIADVPPSTDTDGDGILDDYETRVSETDPQRPENVILPLEIPGFEGGSPLDTLLGTAVHPTGDRIRLFAADTRVSATINTVVDITHPAAPAGNLPSGGLVKSLTVTNFVSSETDFDAAEVQDAELTMRYTPTAIAGLDESSLQPYRFNGSSYDQTGVSGVSVVANANTVTFDSQFSGIFVLASSAGSGDSNQSSVWVDFDHAGIQAGTFDDPFALIADGVVGVTAGGTVTIKASDSAETPLISKAMTLTASGGVVRLGVPAARASSTTAVSQADADRSGFVSRRVAP